MSIKDNLNSFSANISNSQSNFSIKFNEKCPKTSFFFDKIAWGFEKQSSLKSRMQKSKKKSSKRTKKYFSKNNSGSPLKILDGGNHEKTSEESKNMNMAAFFSMVGRILHFFKKIQQRIRDLDFSNVNELQLRLINDKAYVFESGGDADSNNVSNNVKGGSRQKFRSKNILSTDLLNFFQKFFPMLQPLTRTLIAWKALICLFTVFEIFSISIHLFFNENWDNEYKSIGTYNLILKVLLIIDMFVVFNTGIFKSGSVIYSRREAMVRYFQSWFIFDLIAMLILFIPYTENESLSKPLQPALGSSWINWVKMLFFLKLYMISDLYRYIEEMIVFDEVLEGIISLLKLVFQVMMISHLIACAWGYSALSEKNKGGLSWIDDIPIGSEIKSYTWDLMYLYSWYWSLATMITVGYGDISPKNQKETFIACLSMLFGCGFFAYAINSIGLIVERFRVKKKNLKKVLHIINLFMRRKEVDYDLQVRIRKYLEHLWIEEGVENRDFEEQIIQSLSKSLREELLIQSNGRVLVKSEVLRNNFSEEVLEKATQVLQTMSFAPGDTIFYEGDQSNGFYYFVVKGEVEVYHSSQTYEEFSNQSTLTAAMSFGELSFFTDSEREFSARSKGFTTISTLGREDFLAILKKHPIDFEKYHMIKDKVLLYGDTRRLHLSCGSCRSPFHIESHCPQIKFIPNRDLHLSRYLIKCNRTIVKRKFFRRRAERTANPLMLKKNLLQKNDMSESEDSFDSKRSQDSPLNQPEKLELSPIGERSRESIQAKEKAEQIMAEIEHTQRKLSDINIENLLKRAKKSILSQRNEKQKRTVIFDSNNEKNFEDQLAKRSGKRVPSHLKRSEDIEQLIPSNKNIGGQTDQNRASLISYGRKMPLDKRPSSPGPLAPSHNPNSNGQTQAIHDPSMLSDEVRTNELNLDKIFDFNFYFPYNNSFCIIGFMNKKLKNSKTEARKEFLNNKHRSGFIELRDQQRFFLNFKESKIKKENTVLKSPRRTAIFKNS